MRLSDVSIKIFYPILFVLFISCGESANAETKTIGNNYEVDKSHTYISEDIDLIKSVYDIFVFAIDSNSDEISHPEKYFSSHALEKLQDDYVFDCTDGPCYAYFQLRTEAQDSQPGSNEASMIQCIEPEGDRWYIVTYSDMGWPGRTRIKIENEKIDDYQRIAK